MTGNTTLSNIKFVYYMYVRDSDVSRFFLCKNGILENIILKILSYEILK